MLVHVKYILESCSKVEQPKGWQALDDPHAWMSRAAHTVFDRVAGAGVLRPVLRLSTPGVVMCWCGGDMGRRRRLLVMCADAGECEVQGKRASAAWTTCG